MSEKKWFRRIAVSVVACASIVTVSAASGPGGSVVSAQTVDAGGEFHPLTPTRILDTRPSEGKRDVAPLGRKPTGVGNVQTAEFAVPVLGEGGLPELANATDVLAVVMTVTVTAPSHDGYLAVYPTGFQFGGSDISALLTFSPNANVPNLAIVGVGENGSISFNANTVQAGSYDLVVDVFGWISTASYGTTGTRLEVTNPGRILDTRDGEGPNPRGDGVPLQGGDTLVLPIRGADAVKPTQTDIVPDDAAVKAVMVNFALINNNPTSQHTYITATPTPVANVADRTANSLVTPGGIHANMAIVPIGPDGNIHIYNNAGELDLVVDVLGYFIERPGPTADTKGRVVPLEGPFRVFDTREPEFGNARLNHGSKEQWSFKSFAESVTLNPGESNAQVGPPQQGLIGGLFAIDLQKLYPGDVGVSSYLQMSPAGLPERPLTANVNFFPGEIVPNTSLIKYGTNSDASDTYVVEAFNAYGAVHYVLDVYAIVLS